MRHRPEALKAEKNETCATRRNADTLAVSRSAGQPVETCRPETALQQQRLITGTEWMEGPQRQEGKAEGGGVLRHKRDRGHALLAPNDNCGIARLPCCRVRAASPLEVLPEKYERAYNAMPRFPSWPCRRPYETGPSTGRGRTARAGRDAPFRRQPRNASQSHRPRRDRGDATGAESRPGHDGRTAAQFFCCRGEQPPFHRQKSNPLKTRQAFSFFGGCRRLPPQRGPRAERSCPFCQLS